MKRKKFDVEKMTKDEWKEYGGYLRNRPFEEWFLNAFKLVNQKSFLADRLHRTLFGVFEKIYRQEDEYQYVNLNQPPRSAKTTMAVYFMIYACLKSRCEFLYVSANDRVLYAVKETI